MGEAKKRSQQQTDQERAFRATIAEQLAGLYQRRAGIIEARLNTEATIAEFRKRVRPDNAIGSSKIDGLAVDLARTLECGQTCCDMAIDDLRDVWTDAAAADPRRDIWTVPRPLAPSILAAQAVARPTARECTERLNARTLRLHPQTNVQRDECASCASATWHEGTLTGCQTTPNPLPDGRCKNQVDAAPAAGGDPRD